jgi:hypothetical protein
MYRINDIDKSARTICWIRERVVRRGVLESVSGSTGFKTYEMELQGRETWTQDERRGDKQAHASDASLMASGFATILNTQTKPV